MFTICQQRKEYVFDNNLVKDVCRTIGFGNPFDATKVDSINVLPEIMRDNDYALIHIGEGQHQFVKGIDKVYHTFEPVNTSMDWNYRKSLLNEYNTSESNILSVANNQRILHHFLFGKDKEFEDVDITNRPKTYFPHRTKADFSYCFGSDIHITANQLQIEIDLTIEYQGIIGVFEAKNGSPKTFSVHQIYHPFLYYHNARQKPELQESIREVVCVYVVRQKRKHVSKLRLWSYTFTNPLDATSIQLKKSACYNLIAQ